MNRRLAAASLIPGAALVWVLSAGSGGLGHPVHPSSSAAGKQTTAARPSVKASTSLPCPKLSIPTTGAHESSPGKTPYPVPSPATPSSGFGTAASTSAPAQGPSRPSEALSGAPVLANTGPARIEAEILGSVSLLGAGSGLLVLAHKRRQA